MISNSSPLICLSKINRLDILRKLFKKLIIPEAVRNEVIIENKIDSLPIEKAIKDRWIKIENPQKENNLSLGDGENSAISLAIEKRGQLIIDDARAIKIARSLNIPIIRTTTAVLMAFQNKILTKKQALEIIKELVENGYYISPKYYSELIENLIEKEK